MAETRLMGGENLSDGGQSSLEVGQAADIAATGCKVATHQPVQLRQSGRFKIRYEFMKFRVHQILQGLTCSRAVNRLSVRRIVHRPYSEGPARSLIWINRPAHIGGGNQFAARDAVPDTT
jgi:hypothetical protein